jgi:coenzyme F420-reducing hydrogenase beta subunit
MRTFDGRLEFRLRQGEPTEMGKEAVYEFITEHGYDANDLEPVFYKSGHFHIRIKEGHE